METIYAIIGIAILILCATALFFYFLTELRCNWIERKHLIDIRDVQIRLSELDTWCRADMPETEHLVKYLRSRITGINPESIEDYRQKLRNRLSQLNQGAE